MDRRSPAGHNAGRRAPPSGRNISRGWFGPWAIEQRSGTWAMSRHSRPDVDGEECCGRVAQNENAYSVCGHPWSQWFLTFSKPEDPQSWPAGPSLSAVICHWSYLLFMFLRVKGNDFGVPSGNQIFHWGTHCEPPMLELSFEGIPGMFIDVRLCDVLINLIILQSLHVVYNPPW